MLLIFLVYVFLAVPEKGIHKELKDYKEMVSAIPHVMKNNSILFFVAYLLIIRIIPGLLTEGMLLKFIQNGVPKTTPINIETILLPYNVSIIFLTGWFIKRFMIQRLMLFSFILKNVNMLFLLLKFLMLMDYINSLKSHGFDVDIDSNDNSKKFLFELISSPGEKLRRHTRRRC